MRGSDAARPYTDEESMTPDELRSLADDTPNTTDIPLHALSSGGWVNRRIHRLLATIDARDAELASLRLRYREAVKALDRWRMWGETGPQCSGTLAQFFIRDTAVMMTKEVLSTPEAIAILKEGQS